MLHEALAGVAWAVAFPFWVVAWGCILADRSFKGPHGRTTDGCLAIGNALAALAAFLVGNWPLGVFSAVFALWCACDWWRRRRDGQRAARLAGYKARAALAALVRKARESATPRPVLRPIPGGVR